MQNIFLPIQQTKCKIQNFKFLIVILHFTFLILNLVGCQPKQEKTKAPEVIPVKVLKVELKGILEALEYTGNIKAQDEAIVYPKVSGKIIEKVKIEGSAINKGETLAYIDRDEVGLKFEKAPVESPLSGVVGRVYVDIGENVTAQTSVALVINMDKVKIDLDVPEKYLPRVSQGLEAQIRVDAYPEEEFSGQVTKISPVIDLETRSAPIEITVDNPKHRLKSGMFAKVRLILREHKNVPVILKEAVMGKEPNLYVYIVENNQAILRKITLGLRQGPYFEVREGLRQGDRVVIMGQQRLRDGVSVSVEQAEGVNE
jgi:multidrug efflux pump subunit AcrA (membrane-fusion protein)